MGPEGPVGPQGEQGPEGPAGPRGSRGLTFLGTWNPNTTYAADDAVTFHGSSFVALQPNTGSAPVEGADWAVLAAQGETGTDGTTGPQGPQGPMGATGATGPQGPEGPQGLIGPQGPEGPAGTTTADGITSGTLADERLSANVALLDADQIFTGANRFPGGVIMNSSDIQLKGVNDLNHGLGWHGGSSKTFDSVSIGGPVLWGSNGGALGARQTGNNLENMALRWFDDQSVQVLGDLTVGGSISGNLSASQITSGTINNNRISLTASEIPSLPASRITSGTFGSARIASGAITDAKIADVSASKVTGTLAAARIPNLSAGKISSGTLSNARLSSDVARRAGANAFTGANSFNSSSSVTIKPTSGSVKPLIVTGGPSGTGVRLQEWQKHSSTGIVTVAHVSRQGVFSGNGSGLSNLDASKITSGTINNARISLTSSEVPNLNASKITAGSFGAARIGSSAITSGKIAAGAVTEAKIADGAITLDKMATASVGNNKLVPLSIGGGKLQDGAITTAKIADGAVTNDKIADEAVGAGRIADNAVRNRHLQASVVTSDKLATGAVTPSKVDFYSTVRFADTGIRFGSGTGYNDFQIERGAHTWNGNANTAMKFRAPYASTTYLWSFANSAGTSYNSAMVLQRNGNLYLNGSVGSLSDRTKKENIVDISPATMLEKLVSLPIYEWSYIHGEGERHVGPMAQDFHATFAPLGEETFLPSTDVAGVTIAAVQGLHAKVQEQKTEIDQLKSDVAELKAAVAALQAAQSAGQ